MLVEACRQSFAGADPDRLEPLLANQAGLLPLARRHRVQGLAWLALERHASALEPAARNGLASDSRAIAVNGLRAALASRQLLDAHRESGVPLLFLKGLAVGALAYHAPFVKMSSDIDLLVAPEDVGRSADLLAAQGFEPVLPRDRSRIERWHGWHKESIWERGDGLVVELHSSPVSHPRLLPGLSVRSPSMTVEVAPGILLPTFAPDQQFAYLCVHGASSAWFRLKWVADLAGLLHGRSDQEIEALLESAARQGAGRCAVQGLLVAGALFAPWWSALAARHSDGIERALAKTALLDLRARAAPLDRVGGTVGIRLSQLVLAPGAGAFAVEAKRQLVEMIRMRVER